MNQQAIQKGHKCKQNLRCEGLGTKANANTNKKASQQDGTRDQLTVTTKWS